MLRVAIVAGETSGDRLGAGLIHAVHSIEPEVKFFGVAGPAMIAAGCQRWHDAGDLGVMGLAEVVTHLPRLMRLRRDVSRRIIAEQADVFVGIDVPDFNLSVATRVHHCDIPTVQYVSPQVWAWRPGRVAKMRDIVDLVLCLFPFEQSFYDEHGIEAVFVGHPLADEIPVDVDRLAARRDLGLSETDALVALLPGSRLAEVRRLGPDFLAAAGWIRNRRPEVRYVAGLVNTEAEHEFSRALVRTPVAADVTLVTGRTRDVVTAADVVLLSSGTATLETALIKRPMVVAYRVSPITRWLVERLRLLKADRYALPNLLAGRDLVPEIMQDAITPGELGAAVLRWFDDEASVVALDVEFERIRERLRCGASERAARALLKFAARVKAARDSA